MTEVRHLLLKQDMLMSLIDLRRALTYSWISENHKLCDCPDWKNNRSLHLGKVVEDEDPMNRSRISAISAPISEILDGSTDFIGRKYGSVVITDLRIGIRD
ncbi:hypothetical protein AAC387_Pa11g2253 [Persea americana]